jgi:hypothetical protein
MMDVAIYHLGKIRSLCCNREDNRNEKKHADPYPTQQARIPR